MYDAVLGKFFSEDPIGIDPNNPNLYPYCKNDPINRVDPSGLGDVPAGPRVPQRFSTIQCHSPDSASTRSYCSLPDLFRSPARMPTEAELLLDDALAELKLQSKEEFLNVPFEKISRFWSEAESRNECCTYHSGDFVRKFCRIRVPLPCGDYYYFWVVLLPSRFIEPSQYKIIGSDDGTTASFKKICERFKSESFNENCQNFINRWPIIGTGNQLARGEYEGAAWSALGDAALVLGGAGGFFKSAGLLKAAAAVASVGATLHSGRGLYNLLKGEYDDAAGDAIAALAYLWGAKACLDECKGKPSLKTKRLPLPRSTASLGQVEYGATDLSRIAQDYRIANGIDTLRNVAVFEYKAAGGTFKTKALASEFLVGHAEKLLDNWIKQEGIDPKSVTRIYSEFQPCDLRASNCQKLIKNRYPDANVTWSFEYGVGQLSDVEKSMSRRAGKAGLEQAIECIKIGIQGGDIAQ